MMKVLLRIFCGFACITSVILSLIIGIDKITPQKTTTSNEKTIIEVWQIDSFEGGKGSRQDFLNWVGLEFSKKNKNVLVSVSSYSIQSAENSFKEGKFPDVVSYGIGLELPKETVCINSSKEFKGAIKDKKSYGVAWCKGCYVLIGKEFDKSNGMQKVIVSKSQYNQPLLSFCSNGFTVKELFVESPLDAYVEYTSKGGYLLGTQRDIFRLTSRGKDFDFITLEGFNDLMQYVSVIGVTEEKTQYAKDFVEFLLKDDIQKRLVDIGMFSTTGLKLYETDEILSKLEKATIDKTISVFGDKRFIEETFNLSYKASLGDKDAFMQINNRWI